MVMKPWDPVPIVKFHQESAKRFSGENVAIVVTNFNYEKYITNCLDSLYNQTYNNISVVVIDDKSEKDKSVSVIEEWMNENHSRFKSASFLVNQNNQGPSFSRNAAINFANSKYVFILDADNMLFSTAVKKMYAAMRRSDADGVYSQIMEFGDRNQIGSADLWDPDRMRSYNYVDVMALIKKEIWEKVGGFSHIDEGWEDYDFWLKFVDHEVDMCFLPEILCKYRVHGSSRTATEALAAHYELESLMKFRHPYKAAPEEVDSQIDL